ncbi:hypothetical protein SESBI_13995 [Sesbania bispinosa]|nr:hypothetical protein SESBI_13995 [Sesbania bispinosa]
MAQTIKRNPQRPFTSQSTNLPTQNKFTILAPPTPSKPSETDYQYKEKPESLPLVIIEREWFSLPIFEIAKRVFPPDFHFVPDSSQKK